MVRKRLSDLLSHDDTGVADQLIPLIDTFDQVPNPGSVMQWLRSRSGGPLLLQEISRRAHSEPITHELLDSYPQNYALHRIRDLFIFAGLLPPRAELLDRVELWLERLLAQRPDHHGNLVRPFAAWHALRRARRRAHRREVTPHSATYVRTQITVALDFLSWLDDQRKTLTTANQADLDTWLSSRAQTSYFLTTFISWAKARSQCDLTVPARPRTQPHQILNEDDRWNTLRRCLHDELVPLDVRAAAVLVLLFGRSATSFAHLTENDIRQIDGETYLQLGAVTALLPPAAAAVFHALRDATTSRETFHRPEPQTRFLFPGRSPGRPAAAHVITRKLRAHGISALTARNSARAAWTRDIPGPIAADLLGIHINTATLWAGRGRRDWADYISARAEAQGHAHGSAQP